MEPTRICPQCQQPLSADAPDGLCPQCLLKAASGPLPSASGDGLLGEIIDIGDPSEVARKLPQFEILEMLGRGGMGVVYKARQLRLDRLVAVKILPPVDALTPDFVARFSREARALAKLNHPNIVTVYDFGETGGLYYIVMEYVDGTNLRQLFEARKLTPVEALAIVPKICDALQYAHEEGLVHRDIKPENLLIDKKGRVKIADFGLAKLLRREPLDMTLTLSGTALGTLRYMAPEQMDKPETVDHRADLYSLGVVIYEMLTGETPVGRFELPSQKAQVDVRLDQIVIHALEREPARRYQHASEVRDDVERVTREPRSAKSAASAPKRSAEDAPRQRAEMPSESGASSFAGEPRLSRHALWGAIWAPLFLITVVLFFTSFETRDAGEYHGPAWWQRLLSFTLLPAGTLSPFGATILGAIGLSRIKRSGGRLYGLHLAAADALFYPLLALFVIVIAIVYRILKPIPHLDEEAALAISALPALAACFFAGRAAWRSIRPAGRAPVTESSAPKREPSLAAWFIAACALGIAGCLWPCSVVEHGFYGFHSLSEGSNGGVNVEGMDADSAMARAGVLTHDRITTMGGRETHLNGPNDPENIWKETPVGTHLEIKLNRETQNGNRKEIVLQTLRTPDRVAWQRYAFWQFVAGFSLLTFVGFAFISPSFPRLVRWRGILAGGLGLGLLALVLVFEPLEPSKILWRGSSWIQSPEDLDFGQKLAASAAAGALLLLGLFDIRQAFGRPSPAASVPNVQ